MRTVFNSKNYKTFIKTQLKSERFGKGIQSKLAEYLGVQSSFVSLVLKGEHDFSAEHGIQIAKFLGLNSTETEALILLINRDRAGSIQLKKHYQGKIDHLRLNDLISQKTTQDHASKVEIGGADAEENLSRYYETWLPIAVQMALRNPDWNTPALVAKALGADRAQVEQAIELLKKLGLVSEQKGVWTQNLPARFHLKNKSKVNWNHHTNWRQAAIRSFGQGSLRDLHYSLVMCVDEDTIHKISELILEMTSKVDALVVSGTPHKLCAFNIDLFDVSKNN